MKTYPLHENVPISKRIWLENVPMQKIENVLGTFSGIITVGRYRIQEAGYGGSLSWYGAIV